MFSLTFIPVVDAGKNDRRNKRDRANHYEQREYGRNPHYRGPKGGRRHGHYKHGRHYYRGHWKSWNEWRRHYRHNKDRYRGGKYYRDKRGHLMFSFCEQGTCFSFSIKN